MLPRDPSHPEVTVRAWSDSEEEPTELLPVAPLPRGRSRQVWIVGLAAAIGVLVLIALGFLLLVPQQRTVPPLVPITSVTTPSSSPSASTSPPPAPTETVTETVTATSYVPVPARHADHRCAAEHHNDGSERRLEGMPSDASAPVVQRISVTAASKARRTPRPRCQLH